MLAIVPQFESEKETNMKRWIGGGLIALVVLTGTYLATAQPKKKQMVVGVVIDVIDYGRKGWQGEEHAESGKYHVDKGFPVGILEDETGTIYIACYKNPAPASGLETANKMLSSYIGKKVTAQGRVYKQGGLSVIELAIVGEY